MPTKTFLICPIRGVSQNENELIVKQLECDGYEVYYPDRDTNQVDDTGLRICADNRDAISTRDVVHVIWDGKSQGVLFDLGMAFALKKKIIVVSIPENINGKSFQNIILEWERVGS